MVASSFSVIKESYEEIPVYGGFPQGSQMERNGIKLWKTASWDIKWTFETSSNSDAETHRKRWPDLKDVLDSQELNFIS